MSQRIILIACARRKRNLKASARDLYVSTLFKKSLVYAEKISPDHIFILSAKHGLLALDDEIFPYEKTLNTMSDSDIKVWASHVIAQLRKRSCLDTDEFIFLAGERYRRHILPFTKNHHIPLQGLGIGKQLKRLTELNHE